VADATESRIQPCVSILDSRLRWKGEEIESGCMQLVRMSEGCVERSSGSQPILGCAGSNL